MNIKQTPITNAVGLSFFMVLFSQRLLTHFRPTIPDFSILDLKALFRARRYALETLKLLPDSVDPIFIEQVVDAMPSLGSIHPQSSHPAT